MSIAAPFYPAPPQAASLYQDHLADRARRVQLIRLCEIQLWGSILMSRLAIPYGAAKQIQATWIFAAVLFVIIGLRTNWAVSGRRMAGLACVALVTMFETFFVHHDYSTLSILYLFGIYAPLCLTIPSLSSDDLRPVWRSFINLVSVLAVLGLLQIAIQFVFRGYFLDPIAMLPDQFQLSNYAIHYDASIGPIHLIKPNGVFTLEPSFFSQFTALGLIGELLYFRRTKVTILLISALALSFAGTGVVVLLFGIPFLKQAPRWIFGMLFAGMLWFLLLGDGARDFYANRLNEFSEKGTSGNARFVLPYQEIAERWHESERDAVFGIGAGQSSNVGRIYEANFAAAAKVGMEFGILGVIAFAGYWAGMFSSRAVPRALRASLFAFYFIASGALLHPPTVFPLWSLTLGFLSGRGQGQDS